MEKELIEKLKKQCTGDKENDHLVADNILCQLLVTLGYNDLVEEYHKVGKWYA